jgi:hypothetical protein
LSDGLCGAGSIPGACVVSGALSLPASRARPV